MTPAIRHLHVEFSALVLDFQGGQQRVAEVASELSTTWLAVTVTVDDHVTPEMPKLPCSWLWDKPDQTSATPHQMNAQNRFKMSLTTRTGPIGSRSALFSQVGTQKGGL